MKKITCTIRFLTPAFLGDANQNGAWRVPPFKAELRQWWRIVMASQNPVMGWRELRDIEAELFGNAWPGKEPRKSGVRMRLSKWDAGQLNRAPTIRKIENGKAMVDGGLYLGYGEIEYDKTTKGTRLVHQGAIDTNDSAELKLAITQDKQGAETIEQALALMSCYGTVGGRSRNGWGSFALETAAIEPANTQATLIDWREGLEDDWCRGIGRDEKKPLIWNTPSRKNWEAVMHDLAQLRSELNRGVSSAAERGLLSFPITKKNVHGWSNQDRVPNSLRFKVIADGEQRRGLIFHMPCQPGNGLWQKHPQSDRPHSLVDFWQSIHAQLDSDHNDLQRVPA